MKKLLFILIIVIEGLLFKHEIIANNKSSNFSNDENVKENPLDVLKMRMENINTLSPEDFLIDFKALPAPNEPEEVYEYGGASFFPFPTVNTNRNNLITSIKAFNDAHGGNPDPLKNDHVMLFVFTGRYFVGYHKTERITNEIKRSEDINQRLNNITIAIQKETNPKNKQGFNNFFDKDWLEILDAKFTTYNSNSTKIIVFFYVESVLAETELQINVDTAIPNIAGGTLLKKHNVGFLWNRGLEITDWMKLEQKSVQDFFNTNLKRNFYTGLQAQDASGFKTCVDEIKRVFESPINLADLDTLVKTINGLSVNDVKSIPLAKRQEFLNTISRADYLWNYGDIVLEGDFAKREFSVDKVDGSLALVSLLYNLPDADHGSMANFLITNISGSNVNFLKDFTSKVESAPGRSGDTYGNFMIAIIKLLVKSSNTNFSTPKARIAFTDGSLFSDNKTGKYEFSLDGFDDQANIKIGVTYIRVGDRIIRGPGQRFSTYVPRISEKIGFDNSFNPYDGIIFDNMSNYDLVTSSVVNSNNKSQIVPAIFLKYALHNQFNKSVDQTLELVKGAVEVYFTVQTGAGALANWQKARYLWAIAEGGMTIGIVGNGVANALPPTHPWKETIQKWSNIISIMSLGGVATYAGVTGSAKLFYKTLQQKALADQTIVFGGLTRVEAISYRASFSNVERGLGKIEAPTSIELRAYDEMAKLDDVLARMGIPLIRRALIDEIITTENLLSIKNGLISLDEVSTIKFYELFNKAESDIILKDVLTQLNGSTNGRNNFEKWLRNKEIFLDEYVSSENALDIIDDSFISKIGTTFGTSSKQKELAEFIKNFNTGSSPAGAAVYHSKLSTFENGINISSGASTHPDLHIILQDRVDLLKILTRRSTTKIEYTLIDVVSPPGKDKLFFAATPGSHAEVKALSDAIKKVEAIEGLTPGSFPQSRLNEFTVIVKFSSGNKCFPRCPHCWHITGNVKMLQINPFDPIRP
jgi:YwqJ-like deaminase